MPLVYPRTPVGLVLLHVFLEILAAGILCVLLILVSHSFHCLHTPITDLSEQGCLNSFIFVPSPPCLRPLCLSVSILCVCVEIIIWEHAVQIKRKILPCSNCKGFETPPGSWWQLKGWLWQRRNDASVDAGGWGQPELEFVLAHRTRIGVTTQALAYLLRLDAVIWISELFHRIFWHTNVLNLCAESSAFPWCWAAEQPLSPLAIYWLNTALYIAANEWFLHSWLLFYVNNWQHAPCLNPTGTCQVTFSLRFNI